MSYTSLLFANPSFWDGFGQVIDFGGLSCEFNTSLTAEQADELALRSDWYAVGADMWQACSEVRNNQPSSTDGTAKETATAQN